MNVMTALQYRKYLKSKHWKLMREIALERCHFKCICCASTNNLQVHHKSYKRIQAERISDVVVVCQKCHTLIHEQVKDKTLPRMNTWSAVKKISKKHKHVRKAREATAAITTTPSTTIAIRRRNGSDSIITT
jgi:phage terminase large subunit GpA-like protein